MYKSEMWLQSVGCGLFSQCLLAVAQLSRVLPWLFSSARLPTNSETRRPEEFVENLSPLSWYRISASIVHFFVRVTTPPPFHPDPLSPYYFSIGPSIRLCQRMRRISECSHRATGLLRMHETLNGVAKFPTMLLHAYN